ncbi:MAG TPA: leucyl aminopeptidase [Acidimicrobiia bacterium]|nr:leucyl aminopeptidase [Acidimicrobiia bacterium]
MIEIQGAVDGEVDGIVLGVGADRVFDETGSEILEQMSRLRRAMDEAEFTGKAGQSLSVAGSGDVPYSRVVFVGLGPTPDAEQVRRAAGTGARALMKSATVATTLHATGVEGAAEAVGLGFALGAYTFTRHKSDPKPSLTTTLALLGGSDDDVAAARRGRSIAGGVNLARDLINTPAMDKAPETLAQIARDMSDRVGVGIRVLDEAEIVAERLGGLRGVSLGAANPPRLVELRYEPEGARGFVAFVGKGIVFDSGGLSIKPADGMETMKTDMSGAAAVFGAVQVIAELGLPIKVLGITPLTENMPGGSAMRPGDVLEIRNGKTIEVLNTDAEGRLVLADGLSLAAEESPDLIVDIATLTGASKVALGEKIAGLFGEDDPAGIVLDAAAAAGERVWRMPLPDDYRKNIDSDIADMKNTGPRWGGAINAALLLKEFVGEVPWVHLDIAGPARATDAEHYIQKGGTGFGVRTLVEVARRMSAA